MTKIRLAIIFLVVFFTGCIVENPEPAPVASFSYSGDNSFAPCKVTFTSQSQNAVLYSWNFGDGETSTEENPTHIYSTGGTFSVLLTVKNNDGVSNESSKTITVLNQPTKLKITKIVLTGYPVTEPDGAGWDISNGPDLMFKVTDDDGTNFFESGVYTDAVITSLPLTFSTNFPLTINDLNYNFIIELNDYDDLNANDWMGGYYFKPINFIPTDGSAYPSTIDFSSATSEVKFTIHIEWLE